MKKKTGHCSAYGTMLRFTFWGLFQIDIFRIVNSCYNRNMRTDYLNPDLYNRLYSVMTYENVLALRISLETGLRIDDVLSLRGEQLIGRTIRGVAEKTGKPFKKVISADLAKRLHQIGRIGYIFPHRTKPGEHRTRQAVWANMKKAADVMGVQLNAAPHSARKTYAVEVFRDRGLEAAQKELQHDRMSTTMLYAFSNMILQGNYDNPSHNALNSGDCDNSSQNARNLINLEEFAELIAKKVVKFLHK